MVRQEDLALFRGIAVLAETADQVRTNILQNGIRGDEGQWRFPISDLRHDVDRLLAKPDLSFVDTRPPEGSSESFPLICACGDELGASYYAVKHNTHSNVEETSYVIHFSVQASRAYVDGRDFLYPCFQFWDRESSGFVATQRRALMTLFGTRIAQYFDKATASNETQHRIALCDLACQDQQIVRSHAKNRTVIAGRHHVVFSSAFLVKTPLLSAEILGVDVARQQDFTPHLTLDDFLKGNIPSDI